MECRPNLNLFKGETMRFLSLSLGVFLMLLSGCKTAERDSSRVKITQGGPSNLQSVVAIRNGKSNCTGTFLNDAILITSSVCVDDPAHNVSYNGIEVDHNAVFVHPDVSMRHVKYDVALVKFPPKTYKGPIEVVLADQDVRQGEALEIAGYGPDQVKPIPGEAKPSISGEGQLRSGITSVDTWHIGWFLTRGSVTGSSHLAGAARQDRGGPAFRNGGRLNRDGKKELSGIISSATRLEGTELKSAYPDFNSVHIRPWLVAQLTKFGIAVPLSSRNATDYLVSCTSDHRLKNGSGDIISGPMSAVDCKKIVDGSKEELVCAPTGLDHYAPTIIASGKKLTSSMPLDPCLAAVKGSNRGFLCGPHPKAGMSYVPFEIQGGLALGGILTFDECQKAVAHAARGKICTFASTDIPPSFFDQNTFVPRNTLGEVVGPKGTFDSCLKSLQ
jgi:hypothetical protein